MSQEASKFSVASMCHFILVPFSLLSAYGEGAELGGTRFHQLPVGRH